MPQHQCGEWGTMIHTGRSHDVPARPRIAEAAAADLGGPVDLPDIGLPAVVLKQDVGAPVAEEIAGPLDVPGGPGIAETGLAEHCGPVQIPDRDLAAVVLPQDVAQAVVVEVAGPLDMP